MVADALDRALGREGAQIERLHQVFPLGAQRTQWKREGRIVEA